MHVHCVDLGESFQTHIFLQNLASIQPRPSPVKFARPSNAAASAARGGTGSPGRPDLLRAPEAPPDKGNTVAVNVFFVMITSTTTIMMMNLLVGILGANYTASSARARALFVRNRARTVTL